MSIIKYTNLAIFPLNGAILFPKSNLPLNIFEERYVEMIDYSLSTNKKIGMIQNNEIVFQSSNITKYIFRLINR